MVDGMSMRETARVFGLHRDKARSRGKRGKGRKEIDRRLHTPMPALK